MSFLQNNTVLEQRTVFAERISLVLVENLLQWLATDGWIVGSLLLAWIVYDSTKDLVGWARQMQQALVAEDRWYAFLLAEELQHVVYQE